MGGHWRETGSIGTKVASGAAREHHLGTIATRQHGLISIAQLRYVGFEESVARKRVAAGRLFRVRRGVYATHPPPFHTRQLWLAAVLSGGRGALLSDWPAAEALEITPPDYSPSPAIHITVPGWGGRASSEGLVIHRRGPIDPRDRRTVDGIPVTSADLTLVHLAPRVTDIEIEQMLIAADSLGLLKRHRLAELLAERGGRPGISRLLALLDLPTAEVRSPAELHLVPLYRAAGLPRPEFNFPVRVPGEPKPLTVDLAWPDIRLAFELDTQRFHGDWERAEADRDRDQLLALAGWDCRRFFRRQLVERPAEAADRARRIHELRAEAVA